MGISSVGTISIQTGLATGLDTASLIEQLLSIERQPATILQSKGDSLQTKKAALNTFSSKLSNLQKMAGELDGLSTTLLGKSEDEEFTKYIGSASDPEAITLTAKENPQVGTYSIKVEKLAQVGRVVHKGFADTTTALSSEDATFVFKIGNTEKSIDIVGGETTLDDLKNSINSLDAGVKANIVNTGEEVNPYKLVISGEKTGVDNGISIQASTTLEGFQPANFEVQAAADAEITVDGIKIYRDSNTFSDVIEGVEISLKKTTDGEEVQGNVEMDDAGIKGKVENFISAFNNVLSFINSQSYDKEKDSAGVLNGDSLVISLQSRLRSMISESVEVSSGKKMSLIDIGLRTMENGSIVLDSEKFLTALHENPDDIKSLFVQTGSTSGIASQFSKFLKPFLDPVSGVFKARTTSIENSITDMNNQIDAVERRLEQRQTTLIKQFANMEKAVSSIQTTQNSLLQQFAYLGE